MIKPRKFSFKNGLKLIHVPLKESPSATVVVLVGAGSSYENKNNNGISHFLEHMCFKGTQKRPRAIDISSELERLGASHNAFTSRDFTGYYAKVAFNNFKKALDIISDIYLNSLFDQSEIEKEKGVIIEEINMYEDQPRHKVAQVLEKLMYGDQPAGWDVAGTKENIKAISRKDFISYRQKNYTPQNTIVVVSGPVDFSEAKKLVGQYFSLLDKSSPQKPKKVSDNQNKIRLKVHYKDLDQTHISLGIKTFPLSSPKRFALEVLSDILGGGMSSRLFQRIREELGAAYYIGSSAELYSTHGYLNIFAGSNHQKSSMVIGAIREELENLSKKEVSGEELSRAKEHITGNLLLSLETSSDLAFYHGAKELLLKDVENPKDEIRKIKSVTKRDVFRLAKEMVRAKNINLAVVGPYLKEDDFKKALGL